MGMWNYVHWVVCTKWSKSFNTNCCLILGGNSGFIAYLPFEMFGVYINCQKFKSVPLQSLVLISSDQTAGGRSNCLHPIRDWDQFLGYVACFVMWGAPGFNQFHGLCALLVNGALDEISLWRYARCFFMWGLRGLLGMWDLFFLWVVLFVGGSLVDLVCGPKKDPKSHIALWDLGSFLGFASRCFGMWGGSGAGAWLVAITADGQGGAPCKKQL